MKPVKGSIIGISDGYDNGNKYIFLSQHFFQSQYSCLSQRGFLVQNPFPDCLKVVGDNRGGGNNPKILMVDVAKIKYNRGYV